jgi:hypothetical protein
MLVSISVNITFNLKTKLNFLANQLFSHNFSFNIIMLRVGLYWYTDLMCPVYLEDNVSRQRLRTENLFFFQYTKFLSHACVNTGFKFRQVIVTVLLSFSVLYFSSTINYSSTFRSCVGD